MAKCKDCIHSEVCDQSSRMMWAAMSGKTECDDFKDRSRYVVREKGEWIPYFDGDSIMPERYFQCSNCGSRGWIIRRNFCLDCGADMTGR